MFKNLFCLFFLPIFIFAVSPIKAQNCGSLALDDISNPGPFNYLTINQNDGIRNGPDYGNATIYYPDNINTAFACVAIVPGFTATQSSVAGWGPFLASHGIVAMIIDTNSPFDQPPFRALALLDALETLRQEDLRTDSPLFGNIDESRFSVMGHSMGGGGAQLAAVIDPSLKSVIALTPWLNTPSGSDLNHPVPVLIISGELDPIAPPVLHSNVHYNLTPNSTDKMLFEVNNGDHSIANNPANVQGEIGKYALSWLRTYLQDATCYCPLVLTPSTQTSQMQSNVACEDEEICPDQLTQFNLPLADGIYKADASINSLGIVLNTGDVSMQASQIIHLGAGFTVEEGGLFEAVIVGCQ